MDLYDIIMKTYEVSDEILQNEIFKELDRLNLKLENSTEVSVLMKKFNSFNEKYLSASKYKEHYPDFDVLKKSLSKAKEELYSNRIVKEYKNCEKNIENILNDITTKISNVIKNDDVNIIKKDKE